MLSRSQRLSVEQFNSVMEKGRVSHSPLFLVRTLTDQSDTRISAVAPKKVAKTAVLRNTIRRKIYRALRTHNTASFTPGFHMIIFAKTPLVDTPHTVIVDDIKNIFVKSGLLR